MRRPPTIEARQDGLKTYQTEKGWTCRAESGCLAVTVEGLADEEEAVDAATGALERIAKRRGKLPAKAGDRTPKRLREALEE